MQTMRKWLVLLTLPLGACATTGEGTANVTTSVIHFVCLSHKDTPGTIEQVAENNGALKALGAPKPKCK